MQYLSWRAELGVDLRNIAFLLFQLEISSQFRFEKNIKHQHRKAIT